MANTTQTDTSIHLSNEPIFHTITFALDEQIYAIDILYIRDIVMGKQIYRIPNSIPILLGITNLRGEIIPVYSLKRLLDLGEDKITNIDSKTIINPDEDEYLIIIKLENRLFAIAVDHIHKNIGVTANKYNEGSYLSKWSSNTIFNGVIIDDNDNILMIHAPTLLSTLIQKNKELSIEK